MRSTLKSDLVNLNKTLAILGAGHLGQQIAHFAITDGHYKKVVFLDDLVQEATVNGHAVIGKIEYAEQAFLNKEFDELLIGIGYKHLLVRKKLFDQYSGKIPFGKIVHSSCWVDGSAIIKEGAILYPRCIIDARAIVETNTILNLGCTLAHDSIVGSHSFLSPNVAIAGFVRIGERCNLGIASVVIDNLAITATTQLGGGAVVTQNIDIAGLYVGMPAKFVRSY